MGKKPAKRIPQKTMQSLLITMSPEALKQFEMIMEAKKWSKSQLISNAMVALSKQLNMELVTTEREKAFEGAPPEFLRPAQFEDETIVVSPEPEGDEEGYAMGAAEVLWGGVTANITCWSVDDKQLEEITKERRVFVAIVGEKIPPHSLMVRNPIDDKEIMLAKNRLRA